MPAPSVRNPQRGAIGHPIGQSPVTTEESADCGAKLSTWNALVRRARIGRERKAAALTVGSYANPDGTSIKCGVARLATDCEVGYSTARRYLKWLRDVGLIELVRPGNHKKGLADEYRLIIDPARHAHLDIPEAADYRRLIDGLNDANQMEQKGRRMRVQRSPKVSANATAADETSALTMASADDRYQRSFEAPSALIHGEPPPSTNHLPVQLRPSTGGAPPPGPRRPEPPTASGSRLYVDSSLSEPLTPAQDQQGDPLPHARGPSPAEHVAPVYDFFTREVS
jgi:hypothetical protein